MATTNGSESAQVMEVAIRSDGAYKEPGDVDTIPAPAPPLTFERPTDNIILRGDCADRPTLPGSKHLTTPTASAVIDDGATAGSGNHSFTNLTPGDDTTLAARRIIFVDPTVPNLQTLLDGVAPDAAVVVLDVSQDGVQQIADFISTNQLTDLSAIQIVSHGSEGAITLGSTVLDNGNVASYAGMLALIGAALSADGDIMIYGCDVAAGTTGEQFVQALANLTGADVSASTDPTGAAALGGDWNLEASTGPIEAAPAFTAQAESDFFGLLASQPSPTAPQFKVNGPDLAGHSNNGVSQFNATIAALTGGGFVVVWTSDGGDASGFTIWAQLYDDNNQAIGSQFIVDGSGVIPRGPTTLIGQLSPSVTALTDGGFVVAWQSQHEGNTTDSIQAQRYNASGVPVNVNGTAAAPGVITEFKVNTGEVADQSAVTVIGLPNGGFAFTWSDSNNTTVGVGGNWEYDIRVRIFGADGTASPEFTANSTTARQQLVSDIAALSNGNVAVVWQSLNQEGGADTQADSWGIYARLFNAAGVAQTVEIHVNTTSQFYQNSASIIALGDTNLNGQIDDGFIVVWASQSGTVNANGQGGQIDIFGQRFDNNLAAVGTQFQVNEPGSVFDPGASDQTNPSIVALSDGTFIVNWNSNASGIVGRRFDANGIGTTPTAVGAAFQMSEGPASNGNSQFNALEFFGTGHFHGFNAQYAHHTMAQLANGSLAASWTASQDIFARIFDIGLGTPNTAPVLDPGATPVLNNVPEGFANHNGTPSGAIGTLISSLVDLNSPSGDGLDNVTDPDAGAITGIVITALDTTHGDWWYTTDGGAHWIGIGAASESSALALAADANTRIFFAADSGFDGTISNAITFRAWDLSIGTNGAALNASVGGGTSAFSLATDTADITVDPFNEAPTFTGAGNSRDFNEHDGPIALENNFVISDNDDPDLAGARVTIQGFVLGDVLTINGATDGTDVIGDIDFSYLNGVLTLSGDGSFTDYAAVLALVQFQHVGENPTDFGNSPTRTIDWQVDDGHGLTGPLFTLFNPPSEIVQNVFSDTPRDVELADFDGDGILDFVTANSVFGGGRFNLNVQLGNSDGTFGSAETYMIRPLDGTAPVLLNRPVELALGFFNDDALLDIAVTSSFSNEVFVFLGDALNPGLFTPQAPFAANAPLPPGYATGAEPAALASGDFDNDGETDLAVVNSNDVNSVTLLKGDGLGAFSAFGTAPSGLSAASAIAVADLDGDNNDDLVVTDTNGVHVYFGNGDGTFDADASSAAGSSPSDVTLADLNNDGRLDIVVANIGSDNVSVLLQNADQTFASAVNYASGGLNPRAVVVADLDGDGNVDLAIANSGTDTNPDQDPNFDPGKITVLLGAGDGTFNTPPLSFDVGSGPRSLALADVDEDGKLDIVAANFSGETVAVLFNNSTFSATLHTTINVTASNDSPDVVSSPATLTGVPNAPVTLDGIVFADPDGGGGDQTETATFTSPGGVFHAVSGGNVTVSGDNTGTLTLTGSIAALNAFIAADNLTLVAGASTTVHVVIDDGGNTGGSALTDFADINIDLNQPPVFGNNGPGVTYQELSAPILIDPDLTLTDADNAILDHVTVTISPTFVSGDELGINGDLSGSSGDLTFDFDSVTRTLTISGPGSAQEYQDLLDQVTFNNTTNNPTTFGFAPNRTITWVANDGSSNSAPVTTTITIDPVNQAPEFVDVPAQRTYVEGVRLGIAVDAFVNDVDSLFVGGTITVSDHLAGDRVVFFTSNALSGINNGVQWSYDVPTGVFSFTAIDPQDVEWDIFFSRIRYFYAEGSGATGTFGDDPSLGGTDLTRTLVWVANDGSASNNLSAPVNQTINISAVNDGPANTVPGAQSTSEDTDFVFSAGNGNLISVADPDVGGNSLRVTLSVANGVLTLSDTSGLDFSDGDGTDDATMTFTGTVGDINKALDGLIYRGNLNFVGLDTLTITTNDQGFSGSDPGGPDPNSEQDVDTVTIDVTNIDDGPTLTVTAVNPTYSENQATPAVVFSAAAASTVEGGQSFTSMTLTVTNIIDVGNEFLGFDGSAIALVHGFTDPSTSNNNLAVSVSILDSTATITFSGATLDETQLEALIDGIRYFNSSENPTDANRVVTITQLADSGSNTLPDQNTSALNVFSTVNVDPVNDAPANTVPGPQNATEDTNFVFSSGTGNQIVVADVDVGTNSLRVTLSAANGVLTLNGTAGLNFAGGVGDGTDDTTMTFTGSVVDINNALNGLTYRGNLDFSGPDALTIVTNDQGFTGVDPVPGTDGPTAEEDIDAVTINVAAVNDAPVNDVPATIGVVQNVPTRLTGIVLSDVDAGSDIVLATLSVTSGDLVAVSDGGVVVGGSSSAMTLTGSIDDINAFIAAGNVRFTTALALGTTIPLTVTLNDQGSTGIDPGGPDPNSEEDTDIVTLVVSELNDAPVNTVPAALVADEDTALAIAGLSIADSDAGSGALTTTLSVANGTLTVSSGGGAVVANSGTNTVTLTGTLAQINTTLAGAGNVVYAGALNFNGADTLTMITNDGGNTGVDPSAVGLPGTDGPNAELDQDTVGITVNAVNDAPVNTVPGALSVVKNTNLAIAGLAVSDVDAASGVFTTTLSVLHGTLTVASAGGAAVSGSGTASVTLTGTLSEINTTLSASGNVVYKGLADFSGSDTLSVVTNDDGNTGSGGGQSDTDTVAITVKLGVVHWTESVIIAPHPVGWVPAGNGDFNADGSTDLAWYNPTTNAIDIWKLDNGQWAGSVGPGAHPAGYQPVGFGDYNNDGTDDILWFNPTTHDVDLWKISNGQWAGSVNIGTHPAGWTPALSGDFNGDGTSDIAWHNPTTNAIDIWKIDSNGQWAGSVGVGPHPAGYEPALAGDFNGDGTSDIAWYNPTTGDVDIWTMSNGQWAGSVGIGPHPPGWLPLGAADFNLDGTDDIAWQNPTTRNIDIWLLQNGQWSQSMNIGVNPGPVVAVGVGDFDNNGVADVMWRDTVTGHIDNWMLAFS